MTFGNLARVAAVLAACLAAAASATSNQTQTTPPQYSQTSPPPPQQMDPSRALGLWQSTFGAVKIEADNSRGGLAAGALQGVWVYQRQGQEIVGYFSGSIQGNVLKFRWQEPDNPPLSGEGYLVFDTVGRQYSGRWWSERHDRVGDWNGWRQNGQENQYAGAPQQGQYGAYGQQYGGQPYGGQYAPQQPQYPQQPQQPQQPYYPQQPQQQPYYPQQPQPQPPQQPAY